MSGGQVTYGPTPITSGKPGYRTPPGTFKVLRKNRHHRSRAYNNAPMPYAVFFTHSGIAFHEGSLSSPSHGCVRLGRGAAATFFNKLSVGQVVQVVP
jgi:lipoprotein-anchoring transpeptidase ErfK/SrfK